MLSIIIRTRNEERLLPTCLSALVRQNFFKFEILIVDNNSSDKTLDIARQYNCKIINYPKNSKFNYSKAINIGAKKARGDYLAILSAHCVPYDNYWIYNAYKHFNDPKVGAVYSRQLPTNSSSKNDFRDLFQVFRNETNYQTKDFYFNNASSFLRKNIWKMNKFDENINGYEDIYWAKKILKSGYRIVYEANSKVFHYHGINQNLDENRLSRHIKIIKGKILDYEFD